MCVCRHQQTPPFPRLSPRRRDTVELFSSHRVILFRQWCARVRATCIGRVHGETKTETCLAGEVLPGVCV